MLCVPAGSALVILTRLGMSTAIVWYAKRRRWRSFCWCAGILCCASDIPMHPDTVWHDTNFTALFIQPRWVVFPSVETVPYLISSELLNQTWATVKSWCIARHASPSLALNRSGRNSTRWIRELHGFVQKIGSKFNIDEHSIHVGAASPELYVVTVYSTANIIALQYCSHRIWCKQ